MGSRQRRRDKAQGSGKSVWCYAKKAWHSAESLYSESGREDPHTARIMNYVVFLYLETTTITWQLVQLQ